MEDIVVCSFILLITIFIIFIWILIIIAIFDGR